MSKSAVLLVNLGSPDKPDVPAVRRYLDQFLMDPYVIQLPWLLRRLLVSLLVLPTRPKASAHAYQSIWTEEGSPLIALSEKMLDALQPKLDIPVKLAMRYGNPSIETQIAELAREGIDDLLLLPLYPHYADSTVTTAIEWTKKAIKQQKLNMRLRSLQVFYDQPGYIKALVSSTQTWFDTDFDHVLFSYHGIPEAHITKADTTGNHCLKHPDCCNMPSSAHATCYRHQVLKTTELFVKQIGLAPERYSITFQSRLGRAKWLEPSTEATLKSLAQQGVKKVLVLSPAFVTDCLETLEELEIQGQQTFREAGGEKLTLVPCLNDHPDWIELLANWCQAMQQGREQEAGIRVENIL